MITTTTSNSQPNRIPMFSLLIANAISLVGSQLTIVALPWFVLQTTGSASMAGLAGFSAAIPRFLAGIFGGAIIDRLGAKRISVIANLTSGFGIAMIPLLYYTLGLAYWQIIFFVFLGGVLSVPKHVAISSPCLGAQIWRYNWKTPSEIHALLMVTCLV